MTADIGFQVYHSSLERDGHPSLQPFPTVISYKTPTPEINPSGTEIHTPNSPSSSVPQADYPDPASSNRKGPIQPVALSTSYPEIPVKGTYTPSTMDSQDVFQPISLDPVPTNIPSRNDHPVPKLGIVSVRFPVKLCHV